MRQAASERRLTGSGRRQKAINIGHLPRASDKKPRAVVPGCQTSALVLLLRRRPHAVRQKLGFNRSVGVRSETFTRCVAAMQFAVDKLHRETVKASLRPRVRPER